MRARSFVGDPELTARIREEVLRRDLHRCVRCGSAREPLSVHHLNGDHGDWELGNLVTVCGICDLEAHRALRRRRRHQERLYGVRAG